MKIRTGFVSNSSSSSFLLKFPEGISNQEDLRKVLFGEESYFGGIYDGPFSTKDIAGYIWDKTYRDYESVASPGLILDFFIEQEEEKLDYTEWEANEDKIYDTAYKKMREFIKGKNDNLFIVEIEDHDVMGSEVEHDDHVFEKIEFLKNSHH
jgi:hypothetical protein